MENCNKCLHRKWDSDVNRYYCESSGSLFTKAADSIGNYCRLYDNFVPLGTDESIVKYANDWNGTDYYEYFSNYL